MSKEPEVAIEAKQVVLIGNPNSGKTTLFNALTGSRQKVGNWAGVTVEKKMGSFSYAGHEYCVVDLPGVYSLSVCHDGHALDQTIACNYIINNPADVYINIIDATNLERNLYLTTQLLEMQVPVVIALNMMDLAEKRGANIDTAKLAQQLGCPVVPLVANKKRGRQQLLEAISNYQLKQQVSHSPRFPEAVEEAIAEITPHLVAETRSPKAIAMRIIEGDSPARVMLEPGQEQHVETALKNIEQNHDEELDILVADARYTFIHELCQKTLVTAAGNASISEKLDAVVLHRFWGIPVFLGVMYLTFFISVNLGMAFQDFFDIASDTLFVQWVSHALAGAGVSPWLNALLADGLGRGINTIVTFIPVIGAMFLVLTFLEDSGYMARAAVVVDRGMQLLGLPGKSFVPLVVGFGCNVPAIMGARTLESKKDRIMTIMMSPFMSCGARLSVFALFASAFFPQQGGLIIFLLYLIGLVMAIVTGLLLKLTILRGPPSPFVMELPQYHLPSLRTIALNSWHKLTNFLFKAGGIILPMVVLLGVLGSVTPDGKLTSNASHNSMLAHVGKTLTPAFAPMGITEDNWQATVGIFSGVLAKEVVVGTLNSLYSESVQTSEQDEFSWREGLKEAAASIPNKLAALVAALKNPVAAGNMDESMDDSAIGAMHQKFAGKIGAFAYLLFVLLYMPCVSATAAIGRELNRGWMMFSVFWTSLLAYTVAVTFYQLATFAAHPEQSMVLIGSCILAVIGCCLGMRLLQNRALGITAKEAMA